MRYRVRAELWGILGMRRISVAEFGRHVPNCQQWVSYVRRHPDATVSEEWAEAACVFLDVPTSVLFEPVILDTTAPATYLVA